MGNCKIKKCSECGFETEDQRINFCQKCGKKLSDVSVSAADEFIYCVKCGFYNRPDVRFCNKCGNRLEELKDKPVVSNIKEKSNRKNTFSFIGAAAAVSIAAGGIAFCINYNDFNNKSSQVSEQIHHSVTDSSVQSNKPVSESGIPSYTQTTVLLTETLPETEIAEVTEDYDTAVAILKNNYPDMKVHLARESDFIGNGHRSAFAVLVSDTDNECTAAAVYIDMESKSITELYRSEYYQPENDCQIIELDETALLIFDDTTGSDFNTYVWYIGKDNKVSSPLQLPGLKQVSENNFVTFPSSFDIITPDVFSFEGTGHSWKQYWLKWNGSGFTEYGGTYISPSQLYSRYSESEKLINERLNGTELKIRDIILRGNGIINVNLYDDSEREAVMNSNLTLHVDENGYINSGSIVFQDGIYLPACFPDIAEYPEEIESDYKTAYKKFLEEELKKDNQGVYIELFDIENDDIPELFEFFETYAEIYTFDSGKIRDINEEYSWGAQYKSITLIPEKSIILSSSYHHGIDNLLFYKKVGSTTELITKLTSDENTGTYYINDTEVTSLEYYNEIIKYNNDEFVYIDSANELNIENIRDLLG